MKLGRALAWAMTCAALALLATPVGAGAQKGYVVEPPGRTSLIQLGRSHGHSLSVRTFPGGFVQLEASNGLASASYTVRGKVTDHSIRASLGPYGRIAVTFAGTRKPVEEPEGIASICNGRAPIEETGWFEGAIRFTGENGVPGVSATRAAGSVTRKFRRVCKLPASIRRAEEREGHGQPPTTTLLAVTRSSNRTAWLWMPLPGLLTASLQERADGVAIDRSAAGPAELLTALDDDSGGIGSATLEPLPPFSGTAAFSQQPGSPPSWTGSLSVSLPGAGAVPFAGPEFVVSLCRTTTDRELRRCLSPALKELGPGYSALAPRPTAAAPSPRIAGS